MSDQSVLLDIEDGIATITLDEPDSRNALSPSIGEGLVDALSRVEGSDAGCVVVEGEGKAFCAGGDVNQMLEGLTGDRPLDERVKHLEETTSEVLVDLFDFPLPTIAKVDGTAFGAGANLAIACDIQIASDRAAFSFGFRQVGLSVDVGTSYLLPRVVGTNVAKELVFTGEVFGADRAREIGLVNHVYDVSEIDEEVTELAREIADGPDVAFRHTKRLLNEGFEKSIEQAMTDEAVAQGIVFQTEDHYEGVEAFLEGRDPEFEGQ